MKFVYNIEMSHIQDIVLNHKAVYVKNDVCDYERTDKDKPEDDSDTMPNYMNGSDMADYIRDYIGRRNWTIVLSSGTINIFKENDKVTKSSDNKKTTKKKRS
jgi:hypothetical protein